MIMWKYFCAARISQEDFYTKLGRWYYGSRDLNIYTRCPIVMKLAIVFSDCQIYWLIKLTSNYMDD